MKPATVIPFSIQRMICTGCGAEANASCNCGKAYIPAAARAAEAIKANPEKSDRSIAANLGVSPSTVGKARQLSNSGQLNKRVGKDGKARRLPVLVMPTEAEAERSYQATLFDQACLLLDSMAGSTRQRFFAYLKEKYDVK